MTQLRLSHGLLLVAMAGFLLASNPLWAQFRSSVEGTVADSSGALVAGAQVIVTNQETGVAQTSVS